MAVDFGIQTRAVNYHVAWKEIESITDSRRSHLRIETEAMNLQSLKIISGGQPQYRTLNIKRMALSAMDPNSPYGGNGQTVQDQLNQIAQQRATYSELVEQIKPLLPMMSDQDGINYINRRRVFGEVATMRWLVSKYGQH